MLRYARHSKNIAFANKAGLNLLHRHEQGLDVVRCAIRKIEFRVGTGSVSISFDDAMHSHDNGVARPRRSCVEEVCPVIASTSSALSFDIEQGEIMPRGVNVLIYVHLRLKPDA